MPIGALLLLPWIGRAAETGRQPWPDEPELASFFADSIGLGLGRLFRGSVNFFPADENTQLSLTSFWMRGVPSANGYSQLVSPPLLYLNAYLFRKNIAGDLNRFNPWIDSGGSFDVLFKMSPAMGVRYIAGYAPFPQAMLAISL